MTGVHYLDGDFACGEGAMAAGCRFVAGYPITPSTEIVECISRRLPFIGVLIALAAAPSLRRVFRVLSKPRPTEAPPDLFPGIWPLYFVATAFWYNRRFGAWFLLGLILDVGLSRAFA